MDRTLWHIVLFWLDPSLSAEEAENFKGFFEELKRIPGLKEIRVGGPAATEVRPVVDNSFSYMLVTAFDSQEAHDIYQAHELHVRAVEKYSRYWTKVVVHDMLEI